jgi:hypothetical protein
LPVPELHHGNEHRHGRRNDSAQVTGLKGYLHRIARTRAIPAVAVSNTKLKFDLSCYVLFLTISSFWRKI